MCEKLSRWEFHTFSHFQRASHVFALLNISILLQSLFIDLNEIDSDWWWSNVARTTFIVPFVIQPKKIWVTWHPKEAGDVQGFLENSESLEFSSLKFQLLVYAVIWCYSIIVFHIDFMSSSFCWKLSKVQEEVNHSPRFCMSFEQRQSTLKHQRNVFEK